MMPLFAQSTGVYNGKLQIVDYKGKASYAYELIGKDTILNGSFKIQSSNLDALLTKEDTTFSIDGAFDKGLSTGFWKFQFGIFKAEANSQIVDYQYRILASGVQEEAKGLFLNGKPNGPWEFAVNQIQNGDLRKILFKSSIIFENGTPQRNFRIESDSTTLVGRFLRNGFAHDTWEVYGIYNADAMERWFFNDGILEKIVNTSSGKEQSTAVFNFTNLQAKTVNLDTRYLKVLSLQLPRDKFATLLNGSIAKLLSQNAAYYQKIDTILSALGSSKFKTSFGVRLPYYPIDSIDVRYLDTIHIDVKKSRKISDTYLNNTLLNILKLSDKEAATLYAEIETLTNDFVVPLQKLVDYDDQELLGFLTPNQLIKNMWPKGIDINLLKQKANTLPNQNPKSIGALSIDFENDMMKSLVNLAGYTKEQLENIGDKLSDKLSKEERQQELIILEKELLSQNRILTQSIDSVGITLPSANQKALANIKLIMDNNLNDFSTQEELDRARVLVQCYKEMNLLASEVALLPSKSLELSNLYKDRIWNPFMASLMDEEVKKKIINSYKKVLVPYFLEQVRTDITCENVAEILIQIKSTYEKMKLLREGDTKKLERKLRKEEDPLVILELLKETATLKNKEE